MSASSYVSSILAPSVDAPRRDPESDPNALLLHSAQQGDIAGIERAIQRGSHALFSEDMMGMSVLHFATSTCPGPKGTETVRWALGKGIPWNAANRGSFLPEQVAVMHGNKESAKILREWAINHGVFPRVVFASRSHRLSRCFALPFLLLFEKKQPKNMSGTTNRWILKKTSRNSFG